MILFCITYDPNGNQIISMHILDYLLWNYKNKNLWDSLLWSVWRRECRATNINCLLTHILIFINLAINITLYVWKWLEYYYRSRILKIISYEAMKFVRNVLVLHSEVLPVFLATEFSLCRNMVISLWIDNLLEICL